MYWLKAPSIKRSQRSPKLEDLGCNASTFETPATIVLKYEGLGHKALDRASGVVVEPSCWCPWSLSEFLHQAPLTNNPKRRLGKQTRFVFVSCPETPRWDRATVVAEVSLPHGTVQAHWETRLADARKRDTRNEQAGVMYNQHESLVRRHKHL